MSCFDASLNCVNSYLNKIDKIKTKINNNNIFLIAKRYSDRVLPFLLQKFDQTHEKNRIASLTVLKHLINSCVEQMANKKQLVISGVRIILTETNPRVKKNLLQVIIAMAYHGYLSHEGGNLMIDFVLKQCSLADENTTDVIYIL